MDVIANKLLPAFNFALYHIEVPEYYHFGFLFHPVEYKTK